MIDKLRGAIEILDPIKDLDWIGKWRIQKALKILAKVIEEMDAPTPWKSSPPYNGEL